MVKTNSEETGVQLAYRLVTRFCVEQETKVQEQGSTASGSQFLSTPWGSSRRFFIDTRATTGLPSIKQVTSTQNKQKQALLLVVEKIRVIGDYGG
jgi:hypothetical protein